MDFQVRYTEAQQSFRKEVSAWLEKNCSAQVMHSESIHTPPDIYKLQRELGRKLGEMGWLYPTAPAEYGGGGFDSDSAMVIMEELGKRGLNLPPYYDSGGVLGGMAILVWGTEEQKRKYLPPICKGEVRTWQLLTEPSAGSDLAGVSTTAVRDGDEWVINGQKIYIGSDNGAGKASGRLPVRVIRRTDTRTSAGSGSEWTRRACRGSRCGWSVTRTRTLFFSMM